MECLLFFVMFCSSFSAIVADTEPCGYLTANSKAFKSTSQEHVYEYKFYDGEASTFTCKKTTGSDVNLLYTTKDGKKISTGIQPSESVMYMKLGLANNDTTLICIIYDENTLTPVSITLKIVIEKQRHDIFCEVNGLILTRKEQKDNYYSEYKFHGGENVTVAVVTGDEVYKKVKCSSEGLLVPGNTSHYYLQSESTRINFTRITFNFILNQSETWTCNMDHKNDSIKKYTVFFLMNMPEYNPYISGLSMSNVLLQYSNKTSNIIQYEVGSETLYLKCSAQNYDGWTTEWQYQDSEVLTSEEPEKVPRPFQLQNYKENAIIQCKLNSQIPSKVTCLQLLRGKESTTAILPLTGTKGTVWIIVFSVVVVILLIAVGLWIWYSYSYKKRLLKNNSSNTVTYDERNSIENLYVIPISKEERTKIEPTYAVPVDSIRKFNSQNEPTYASVQTNEPTYASVQKSEPTYASVHKSQLTHTSAQKAKDNASQNPDNSDNIGLKVSESKGQNENQEAENLNNITYAEICHRDANVGKFNPNEKSQYSEIVPQKK